jgi:hypothetical protein
VVLEVVLEKILQEITMVVLGILHLLRPLKVIMVVIVRLEVIIRLVGAEVLVL